MKNADVISTFKTKFQIEEKLLNKFGKYIFLYPRSEKLQWKIYYGYYFCLALLSLTILQLALTFAFTGFDSLSDFSNVSPNLGLCLMTLAKYIIIHNNKTFLNHFSNHYGKLFWKSLPNCNEDLKKILETYMFSAKIINRILIGYSLPLICIVDSLPYMITMYENKILGKEPEYLYPFDGWYPFDKIEWYYAIYLWESIMTGVVVIIYMYSTMLNLFVIVCMCMELKILGYNIRNLLTESDVDIIKSEVDKSNIYSVIKWKLRDIIGKHSDLACICKNFDRIVGITMFGVYTMGSALMCLTAFTSSVADNSYQAIRCFCFFAALVMDAFNYCLIGQFLSDHSIQLALDIYESQWIYADQKTKKTLLILLIRVQQRIELTASGFVAMNLNTFTSIIATAYRFFNLLHTVYEP